MRKMKEARKCETRDYPLLTYEKLALAETNKRRKPRVLGFKKFLFSRCAGACP